jgi:hypothetical protein
LITRKTEAQLPVSEKIEAAYLNPVTEVAINVPEKCISESSRDQAESISARSQGDI